MRKKLHHNGGYTVPELAGLSKSLTAWQLYKAASRRTIGRRGAVELERITGIPREQWVWPGHYRGYDPWTLISRPENRPPNFRKKVQECQ